MRFILLHVPCQKSGNLIGVDQWSLSQIGNTCHVVLVKAITYKNSCGGKAAMWLVQLTAQKADAKMLSRGCLFLTHFHMTNMKNY